MRNETEGTLRSTGVRRTKLAIPLHRQDFGNDSPHREEGNKTPETAGLFSLMLARRAYVYHVIHLTGLRLFDISCPVAVAYYVTTLLNQILFTDLQGTRMEMSAPQPWQDFLASHEQQHNSKSVRRGPLLIAYRYTLPSS